LVAVFNFGGDGRERGMIMGGRGIKKFTYRCRALKTITKDFTLKKWL
jgi:hypothetical protein